jgi:DNA-binding NarL/FixJ family response regulator
MQEKRLYAQNLKVGLLAVEPIRLAGLRSILEEIRGVELAIGDLDRLLADSLDLAVISLMIPAETLTTIERLRASSPAVRIIVMSEYEDDESVIAAISAGAKGYLPATIDPADVAKAVEVVASGSIWAPRKALSMLVDRMLEGGNGFAPRLAPQFTQRELEVLQLLVSARSNREIAEALGIEVRTVKSYVGRMMRKVGVGNRIALSIHAAKHTLGSDSAAK